MVAIAKDVIKQIKLKKYTAITGSYVFLSKNKRNLSLYQLSPEEIQKEILSDKVHCRVCAKGATVISRCRLGNTLDEVSVSQGNKIQDVPEKVLDIMEVMFEVWTPKYEIIKKIGPARRAFIKYRESFLMGKNPEDRLLVIMKNIVANKGDIVLYDVNITEKWYAKFKPKINHGTYNN